MIKLLTFTSRQLLALVTFSALSVSAFGQGYSVPNGTPGYIKSAVESSEREEAATSRDANRMPAEVLTLSGIEPGDTVLEFAGFGQYYTTMLSDIVGNNGSVTMYDLPYTEARAGDASRAFVASHSNTEYVIVDYNEIALPQSADLAFNVLYYHDLPLNDINTAALNKKILNSLKPGGVFMLIDHNAAASSGTRDVEQLHRIDPAVIVNEVIASGFELVEISSLLAHPEDDHTQMVFAQGLRGLTDRTVFKFRKPE